MQLVVVVCIFNFLFFKEVSYLVWRVLNFFEYISCFWYTLGLFSKCNFLVSFMASPYIYLNFLQICFCSYFQKFVVNLKKKMYFLKKGSFFSIVYYRLNFIFKKYFFLSKELLKEFKSYPLKYCCFNFIDFFIVFLDMSVFFFSSQYFIFSKFVGTVCKALIVTASRANYAYSDRLFSIIPFNAISSSSSFRWFCSFTSYKLKANLGIFRLGSLKTLFRRLYFQCFRRRRRYNLKPTPRLGAAFFRFFHLNCASWLFTRKFGNVAYFGGKPFIFFFLYFVYQLDFVYKILKDCEFLNFFMFYLLFFFKNWNFLTPWFFKLFFNFNEINTEKVFRLKGNVTFYRIFFEYFFYRKFSFTFRNLIISTHSKFFKYFTNLYSKRLFLSYKEVFAKNLIFCYVFRKAGYRRSVSKSQFFCYKVVPFFVILGFSTFYLNSFNFLNKILACINQVTVSVGYLNFGVLLFSLLDSNWCGFKLHNKYKMSSFCFYNILLVKWHFQIKWNLLNCFIRSFLFAFNIKYFKSLCVLYSFFFFGLNVCFKFYFNFFFVNFVFFCEFFHFIFKVPYVFKFFFLKTHFTDYRFGGFLGLFLLFFKLSKLSVFVSGYYVLDYIFDIFFNLFITNRYTTIRYFLSVLSQMFNDFLQLNCFCGFNFKIKGRLSKKTQRKQCFVLRNGVLSWTTMSHNLFVGKRILTTHIGSVSIQLAVQLKRC